MSALDDVDWAFGVCFALRLEGGREERKMGV